MAQNVLSKLSWIILACPAPFLGVFWNSLWVAECKVQCAFLHCCVEDVEQSCLGFARQNQLVSPRARGTLRVVGLQAATASDVLKGVPKQSRPVRLYMLMYGS